MITFGGKASVASYVTFRHAKAEWELALYRCEVRGEALTDEEISNFADAHATALNAFLLGPTENLAVLALKVRVFHAEAILDGWHLARQIVEAMDRDAGALTDA